MSEQEFGRKICREMDAGLSRLDGRVLDRLDAARRAALAASGRPAKRTVTGLALVGGWLTGHDSAHVRHVISGLALLACLGGAYVWFTNDAADDDVDAILLADELPPQAYLDHQFDKWLNR